VRAGGATPPQARRKEYQRDAGREPRAGVRAGRSLADRHSQTAPAGLHRRRRRTPRSCPSKLPRLAGRLWFRLGGRPTRRLAPPCATATAAVAARTLPATAPPALRTAGAHQLVGLGQPAANPTVRCRWPRPARPKTLGRRSAAVSTTLTTLASTCKSRCASYPSSSISRAHACPHAGGGLDRLMLTRDGASNACGSGSRATASSGGGSAIFAGVSIYVDGITTPSNLELRDLIVKHGGDFQYYLVSSVTHIVATHLPDAKVKQLRYGRADQAGGRTGSARRLTTVARASLRLDGPAPARKRWCTRTGSSRAARRACCCRGSSLPCTAGRCRRSGSCPLRRRVQPRQLRRWGYRHRQQRPIGRRQTSRPRKTRTTQERKTTRATARATCHPPRTRTTRQTTATAGTAR